MAEPTCPPHPNHRPYDATIAGVVRLLGCDASILASAVPMLLIASVTLALILLLFLINSPCLIGTAVLVPTTEKFWVRRTDGYCYAALPFNAAERPRREAQVVRFSFVRLLTLREGWVPKNTSKLVKNL